MAIVPDTKNWTWVLERPCPDCGLETSQIAFRAIPGLVRENSQGWRAALAREDVRVRPDERTWSALEYGAHVRDVFRIFRARLALMLEQDEPSFPNWDQDKTAEKDRYGEQDPGQVLAQLLEAAEAVASAFEAVPDSALGRRGLRGDGSAFTVESLARYFIHDPVHHLWDVGRA
ncbi:DinB family protein [Segniliparus rugosus]|uniref:DinB family protein n=1 Tax=Segniliparus rugosus TaxID=286804 RepID=UPI0001F03DB9|nr:DinB family protein [Segniliparus rugosus]